MTTINEIELARIEVTQNYQYFQKMLPEWQNDHLSKFALIHKQQLVGFFDSLNDAFQVGMKDHGWGDFSVQSVKHDPIDLGHQSNALF